MPDSHRLFLLDGMALLYRAHFAFIRTPIRTSKGLNTSAAYGFTTALLDLLDKQAPTHLALVLDTQSPTFRHREFEAYKAQRQEMPEDLAIAIPMVRELAAAFGIPVLAVDGYEADDVIGTLATRAATEGGYEVFMVTPDKDFAQLVSPCIRIYKPGRQGGAAEILGPAEIHALWGIGRAEQVADVLALMGDSSDNIPGVPGIGEKTAKKLIGTYGSLENVLSSTYQLPAKQKELLEKHADQARLCKRLATIHTDVPLQASWEDLRISPIDREKLARLFVEWEFNSLGRRVLGPDFKAGRGHVPASSEPSQGELPMETDDSGQGFLLGFAEVRPPRSFDAAAVDYQLVDTPEALAALSRELAASREFAFDTETTSLDPLGAALVGLSFALAPGRAWFVPVPADAAGRDDVLNVLRPALQAPGVLKIGQNLKYDLAVLRACGHEPYGPFFDTMLAHALLQPDQRHSMDYMAEALLGYTPIPISSLLGEKGTGQCNMADVFRERPRAVVEYACEDADITLQLRRILGPELERENLDSVFHRIECPLLPVLVAMETEGIRIDPSRLEGIGRELQDLAAGLRDRVLEAAGVDFNLNSPRQLGEVLFGKLKLIDRAKKTKTGQYVTNEQVLADLSAKHPIARDILAYREATKLKNTYVDALPAFIHPRTGRVHTHFHQLAAATGRLASTEPNLQNIPVRTELGRGIRDAFVPRDESFSLLSADYSQIELRVMAALSGDPALCQAFTLGQDIHTATAARVYGVDPGTVDGEMRRRAKMVNFGIIYGISAFGLAQRLGIPRGEAETIIQAYFERYPGVKDYMERTIAKARESGYVETLAGRRRIVRDLNSANQNIRSAAERVAINTPIQGTAADMIKLAMLRAHDAILRSGMRSRLLLQVHDELVFDLAPGEDEPMRALVTEAMTGALPLDGVPVTVEIGIGKTWLQAH